MGLLGVRAKLRELVSARLEQPAGVPHQCLQPLRRPPLQSMARLDGRTARPLRRNRISRSRTPPSGSTRDTTTASSSARARPTRVPPSAARRQSGEPVMRFHVVPPPPRVGPACDRPVTQDGGGNDRRFPAPARAPRTFSTNQSGNPAAARDAGSRAVPRQRSAEAQPGSSPGTAPSPQSSAGVAAREYQAHD